MSFYVINIINMSFCFNWCFMQEIITIFSINRVSNKKVCKMQKFFIYVAFLPVEFITAVYLTFAASSYAIKKSPIILL